MRTAALLLVLALGCREAPAPSPPPKAQAPVIDPRDSAEAGNLLNMAGGASIVSRTAELTLESSAALAIDGDSATGWATPPGDWNQTVVMSLPAPARIERVGIRTPAGDLLGVNNVSFEASRNGRDFATLADPALTESADTQLFPVTPTEFQYLRLTITGAAGSIASVVSVQAHGALLSSPQPGSLAGCWAVNGEGAQFTVSGGALQGRIASGTMLHMDGGVQGALYRFAWVRGADRGYGAITVAPDGKTLSGLRWYVKARPKNFGGSWFGERSECPPTARSLSIAPMFLNRGEAFPLFGLHFDEKDHLVEAKSSHAMRTLGDALAAAGTRRVEIVSRELREATPAEGLRRARARLDSLRTVMGRTLDVSRVTFTPATAAGDPDVLRSDLLRAMNSVLEVSVK